MRTSYGSRYEEDAPLPSEEVPVTVNARLALAAAKDENGHSLGADLSRAEQQRVDAELWKAQNGFGERSLQAFRSMDELYGLEAYLTRKLGGEISARADRSGSPQIAFLEKKRSGVRAEIARRRNGGRRVPFANRVQYAAPRAKGKSPGRSTNASKLVTKPTALRMDRNGK